MARPTREQRQKVVDLYLSGNSKIDIQVETGISQVTIRRILKTAGFAVRNVATPRTLTEDIRNSILALRQQRLSYNEIARRVGISKRTVINVCADDANKINAEGGRVSAELFIRTWQANERVADVARALGLKTQSVLTRAYNYRSKGVPLKKYKSNRGLDWDSLREFAELFSESDESDDD